MFGGAERRSSGRELLARAGGWVSRGRTLIELSKAKIVITFKIRLNILVTIKFKFDFYSILIATPNTLHFFNDRIFNLGSKP